MSKRGDNWLRFSEEVRHHVDNYTVPQYGDAGEDRATHYTAEECIKQVEKYTARFGRNQRPGQQRLDLLKAAHYIQLAAEKLERSENETN